MSNPTKPTTNLTREELREAILNEGSIPRRKQLLDNLIEEVEMQSYKRGFKEAESYTQAREREALASVTRFEVIDHRQCFWCRGGKTANVLQKNGDYKERLCDKCDGSGTMGGRVYGAFSNAETSIIQIEQSFQDDGKTLKIFVKDKENL